MTITTESDRHLLYDYDARYGGHHARHEPLGIIRPPASATARGYSRSAFSGGLAALVPN